MRLFKVALIAALVGMAPGLATAEKVGGKSFPKKAGIGSGPAVEEPTTEPEGTSKQEPAKPVDAATIVQQAKDALTRDFLDPDSAKFRGLILVVGPNKNGEDQNAVCGEFNGKNAYGAYTGYKRFVVLNGEVKTREDTEVVPQFVDSWWKMLCKHNQWRTLVWSQERDG